MTQFRKLLLSAIVLGLTGVVVGAASWSAFSGTTSNSGNTFTAGNVQLTDDDGGSALLSLTNATPGATTTGCITVTYGGSLSAGVRLYGTSSGALAPYLTLKVTRGTNAGTAPSCSFTPDTRDYLGHGAGVVYSGTLDGFPTSHATGIVDPKNATGGAETWASPDTHAYKLEVTLQNDPSAQGQVATASFTWEARNQ
jgi:hypothetical protein